ncbi:MAG TPA: glycosyltransferase [Burkholderiales bacterium]|nr:glycosyltransferase [Burkholderiales bacterium]
MTQQHPALPRVEWSERPRRRAGRPFRVLFLADHLGLPDGGVHGVTTWLLDVLPALKETGMEVAACILRRQHPGAKRLRDRGIDVVFLESSRFDLFVIRQVDEIVRKGGFEIVHCTQFRSCVVGRAVARLRKGVRVVLHVHDLSLPPSAVRLMNRVMADPLDMGICVSEACRDVAVHGYHLSPERIRILYTGIDTSAFRIPSPKARAQVRLELGISASAPVICLTGRFAPVKGQAEMIRMMKAITIRRPECILMLIGSGSMRVRCERLTKELGLVNNVRFMGYRQDVSRWLAAADVAVVPSRSEGLSRTAIEANLCGLPVVAYSCGGVSEAIVGQVCGELVTPGSPVAFVDAVVRMLDQPADAAAAERRALAAGERFGLAAHVQSLRACYETLQWP